MELEEQQERTYEALNLTIWEMADLEYMKHTFIDTDDINCGDDEDDHCHDS